MYCAVRNKLYCAHAANHLQCFQLSATACHRIKKQSQRLKLFKVIFLQCTAQCTFKGTKIPTHSLTHTPSTPHWSNKLYTPHSIIPNYFSSVAGPRVGLRSSTPGIIYVFISMVEFSYIISGIYACFHIICILNHLSTF